jgi:basic membrane protein A
MDPMAEMAEEHPDVIFSHCSGYKSNDKNFNNYFGVFIRVVILQVLQQA